MLDKADYTTLLDHSIVWGVYIAAALVILLSYWALTRRWWFELRWLLFALLAVFMLVPAPLPGKTVQAPAMIIVALSPFTGAPELVATVLARLLVVAVAAIALVVIVAVARRLYLRKRSNP
ncbi:MAG: hypothetical protein QM709_14910 [Spongiibacteraceae bacterium]